MNRLSNDIPNRIKQPGQCCSYCGKSYLKKTNLDKHFIICELLNTSKNKNDIEDEDETPSQKKLYKILLELGNKFNKLEEKVNEMEKWIVKKKKKINIIEWLNTNIIPEAIFGSLNEKITIDYDDVNYLFENTFIDTLNNIFSRTIYNIQENKYPIYAFSQKSNTFYYYENEELKWSEISKEILIKFLDKIFMKLLKKFSDWKKEHVNEINNDEKLSLLCDKTSIKMMSVDFKQESIFGKIKSNMYSRMKTDLKALIEYEFEF